MASVRSDLPMALDLGLFKRGQSVDLARFQKRSIRSTCYSHPYRRCIRLPWPCPPPLTLHISVAFPRSLSPPHRRCSPHTVVSPSRRPYLPHHPYMPPQTLALPTALASHHSRYLPPPPCLHRTTYSIIARSCCLPCPPPPPRHLLTPPHLPPVRPITVHRRQP